MTLPTYGDNLESRILYGTHGNEWFGPAVGHELDLNPVVGLRHRNAHPEVWEQGKGNIRFLGTRQLQACYPGDPAGDPEDRAAYNNERWLDGDINSPGVVVYDVHNNHVPNLNCLLVGRRILKATVAGGLRIGYDRVVLSPGCTFKNLVNNAASIEQSLDKDISDVELVRRARVLRDKLADLSILSADRLRAEYETAVSRIQFFSLLNIPTRNAAGGLADYMEEVESIATLPVFSPLKLSESTRRALAVPLGAEITFGTWGHDNMSNIAADLGDVGGVPRLEYFGDVFVRIPPPVSEIDDPWARFAVVGGP